MNRLRELDDRFVPLAAERTRRWLDSLVVRRSRWARQRDRLAGVKAVDLDARYAGSGPLATVRELPQVGFIVIAAVFLAATATAVVRNHPGRDVVAATAPELAQPASSGGNHLGPEVGETSAAYVAISAQDLKQAAQQAPGGDRFALVSFKDYRTPAQVVEALGSYHVRRVFVRAKVGGSLAPALPFDIRAGLAASLRKAYEEIALSRLSVRRAYLEYVATTTDDKAFHDDYAAFAASTGREVVAYEHGCACIFAAIVEGPARSLLSLPTRPGVRAVQVAGKTETLPDLVVQPLLPETVGMVSKLPMTQAP